MTVKNDCCEMEAFMHAAVIFHSQLVHDTVLNSHRLSIDFQNPSIFIYL